MCGIAGIIDLKGRPIEESSVRSMLAGIKHRGPDDEGVFIDSNVCVGQVRLSILDLTQAGKQPFFSQDERYAMVYNGEVYNYLELRDELKKLGHGFHTATDTEVILAAYIEWGKEFLHRLNGMFAFVIYDTQNKEVFAARDRFGIKPFLYTIDDDRFIFCSEINPIIEQMKTKPSARMEVVYDYLTFNRVDQSEHTFFQQINKLWHGHHVAIDTSSGELNINRWYDLRTVDTPGFVNPQEYAESLSRSVRLRLRSDVPVGVCLSGGLDSSCIVSLLHHKHGLPHLNTFSAVYGDGKRGDESNFINLFKDDLPNMHFTYPDGEGLLEDYADFIRTHGEPISTTAPYAQYKVMRLAKDHVTVTLDGQGADEALAGYHYLFGFYFKELFRGLKLARLLREISSYRSMHQDVYALKAFAFSMLPSGLKSKAQSANKGYLNADFANAWGGQSHSSDNLYNANTLNDALYNHFDHKLEHLLKWSDRNSMRFSLESRTPFLDYKLVEGTIATPASSKLNAGWTKHIMREAMTGILPEQIRLRKDKVGFVTPEDEWFRSDGFKELIMDHIRSESFANRKIINQKKAEALYTRHLAGEINISKDIWKWLNLEIWFRQFVDRA